MAEGLGDLEGQVLGGRYRLGAKVGQGGMGTVYAATQTSLGRQVAVKVLLPQLSTDESLVARFRAEAERSGQLNHPHIVQVFDFGKEDGGSVWIAMELLDGEPLTDRIAQGPLSEADAVRFTKEALAGLEAAHRERLVHRDLKPDNIFITKVAGVGERVKLLDFGIAKLLDGDSAAKLTATGLVIGTPLYMSAEQARGDDLDERSDLYSLGAVMYEMLTGEPPFTGRNYNALLVAVLTQTARPITELRPDLSPELAAIVMRALEKDMGARFGSAREMSAALDGFTPKTTTPASNAELGMASTMATPGAGLAAPAISAAAATSDTRPSTDAGSVPQAAPTALGTSAASAASAAAATAMAEGERGIAPRPAVKAAPRRHGWLLPAMVAVALLAGITGTATMMQMGGGAAEPDSVVAVATESSAGEQPAATVTPVAPVEVAPPAVPARVSGEPPAVPGAPTTPAGALALRGNGDPADTAPETTPDRAPAKRRPAMVRRPRVSIGLSGGTVLQHRQWRAHLANYANWSSCWPRNLPFPEMNRGVTFRARTTPDGALSGFSVAGNDNYPAVSACLMERLAGASMGPAENGEGGEVRIGFSFYEVRR